MSKRYRCERIDGKVSCDVVVNAGRGEGVEHEYALQNVGYHSPDGFEMGYAGSGPADLALTILLDYFGSETKSCRDFIDPSRLDAAANKAWRYHQDFKRSFIAPHDDRTTIASSQIDLWLSVQEEAASV
jgi:hypothetical protein